ncbi:MAG: GatB/YqeY domain-containing protein [Betaproteobacteria bacterium]|jgi:hypothetical protein|nr:GatB/YqeY domain-containing protein [Betaproteobacteria bacterium]
MSLRTRVGDDMKAALKAKETRRLSAIRLLLAAIKQREVDERKELADAEVVSVIEKMLKQRRDSIEQFRNAGRQDLADAEEFEVQVLTAYLPQQASDAEITREIDTAMEATGAGGMADMGKVMAHLKAKLAGRADMAKVSAAVKAKLAGR